MDDRNDERAKGRVSRRLPQLAAGGVLAAVCGLFLGTWVSLEPLPAELTAGKTERAQFLDRSGSPLAVTYSNTLNGNPIALHQLPPLLSSAMVAAEDKRFFDHSGVDWFARLAALRDTLRHRRFLRGARTITEQVVRILHPRPSNLWTRWLEGFEAAKLEERFSKAEILEFYLNQVPYSRLRRGVVQASELYFNRDISTLSAHEVIALAVLPRAPSRFEKVSNRDALERRIKLVALRLVEHGALPGSELGFIDTPLTWESGALDVDATHFVSYARKQLEVAGSQSPTVRTTLDAALQDWTQLLLDSRIEDLRNRGVSDGAALIVDHHTNQILAWVNAGRIDASNDGSFIDAITTRRQPGSTLKPFLYATALEKGWTAASLVDDSPLFQAIRLGLHNYRNYSRIHYGPVRVREALGNSLNIPAIRAVRFVDSERFLTKLHDLGFASLEGSVADYGEGLALGNGEVTLLELVRAYTVLARGGEFRHLELFLDQVPRTTSTRVFSAESASIIADILADSEARRKEFGAHGMLDFPVMTAVKTGTSNDFRDSWAVGFSERFTAGVWMGNLNRRATDEISGARGPALVLRAIFQELGRLNETKPLPVSRALRRAPVCAISGLLATGQCPAVQEWFTPGTEPHDACTAQHRGNSPTGATARPLDGGLRMLLPTRGLRLAKDPRIPDASEAFAFEISHHPAITKVEWYVDDQLQAATGKGTYRYLWPVVRGEHRASAKVWVDGSDGVVVDEVPFSVR